MNIYCSRTYMDDLDTTIAHIKWLSEYKNKSIFITGATGLICSSVIDLLLRYSELHEGCIKVYAAGRNREKVEKRFSRYYGYSYFQYVDYDACKQNTFNFDSDYVIHGASNAFPAMIQEHPIDTMKDNFNGMLELLDYAVKNKVIHTVFISSSEVYGQKKSINPFKEDEYGFIDILSPRSSYSIGKRATETLCASYVYEKNISISIVRPGHIYGPTANRVDNRVSSAFAYAAADGKDLVLKSKGSQIRSYCYMLDCATAILLVLLKGKAASAYNISNPNSIMSIREIAEFFAMFGNTQLKFDLPTELEIVAFNPMQNSILNSEKLQRLGWKGIFDPYIGTSHTIKILNEAQN